MSWWIWILLGLGLLAAEAMTPTGFFVFFFGLSALLVGGLAWLLPSSPPQFHWLLFSIFSIVSLLLLRPRLMGRFADARADDGGVPRDFIGETAVLVGNLEAGGVGKAEFRGTSWSVRSRHVGALVSGTRCAVEKVEGLTLWVKAPQGDI